MPLVDPEAPGWARRLIWIGAALVAALLILVIVLVVRPERPGTAPDPSTTPSAAPAKSDSVCGLPNGDQAAPTEAPDTTWVLKDGFAVPTSKVAGPGVTSPVAACFARNPVGALFAALNASGDVRTADVEEVDAVIDRYTAAPKDMTRLRDAFMGGDRASVAEVWQAAGFRFLNSSPDVVTFDLLMSGSAGGARKYISRPVTMKWERGDWRVAFPIPQASVVADPFGEQGFIEWGGVGG